MRCQRAEIREQERKLVDDVMRGVYELNTLETKLKLVDEHEGGADSKVFFFSSVFNLLLSLTDDSVFSRLS